MADEAAPNADQGPAATSDEATFRAAVPMGDENAPADWSPPQTDANGVAIDGDGLPINLRLRAAALADKGKDEDPAGAVEPEAIAAERERLAAYDKAYPAVAGNLKTDKLEALAKAEKVDLSGASTNQDRVALINAARPARV